MGSRASYTLDRYMTQEEVAGVLKITRGRVAVLERRALAKMRAALENDPDLFERGAVGTSNEVFRSLGVMLEIGTCEPEVLI